MAQSEVISEKQLKKYLYQWRIPERLRSLILKELLILGLLEKDKQYHVKIIKPKFTEEKINDYYFELGIIPK